MWGKIKELIKLSNSYGMPLPMVRDEPEGRPSFTLLCVYISFMVAVWSVIGLYHDINRFVAACTAISFWVIAMVFYRLKKLDKAKIDLDDKSIELNSEEKEKD